MLWIIWIRARWTQSDENSLRKRRLEKKLLESVNKSEKIFPEVIIGNYKLKPDEKLDRKLIGWSKG